MLKDFNGHQPSGKVMALYMMSEVGNFTHTRANGKQFSLSEERCSAFVTGGIICLKDLKLCGGSYGKLTSLIRPISKCV